ncbi:MAG: 30S ribosomal protein S20 [Candidatus Aminicenantes bacterium]|nr:30S ribosomal protein S20 [Candidatus Aminicenantes bacterium]
MAKHLSAIRQHRRSIRRTAINRKNKSVLRTQVKKLREVIPQGDKKTVQEQLPPTISLIDKSVKKGAIHRNKGARLKSRLTRKAGRVNPTPSS